MGYLRKRLTYANVASTIALVLAMSGTSYALIVTGNQIKDNSIKSADLKNGSVAALDLMAGSVGSEEVINSSLKLPDLNPQVKDAHRENAFLLRRSHGQGDVFIGHGPVEGTARIATLNLPPGTYVVNGSFGFKGGDGGSSQESREPLHEITCEIGDPNQGLADRVFERYTFDLLTASDRFHYAVVPMTFVGGVDADGLAVNCWFETNTAMSLVPVSTSYVVSAIQVDSITAP